MNLSNKLNSILKEYSAGNKTSAYKKFKKIYLQSNRDIKLRYNLAVMQQELGLLDEAETNYISLIKHKDEPKYNINLYNLYITKGLYLDALKIIDSIKLKNLSLIKVDQDRAYILYLLKNYRDSILQCDKILTVDDNNVNALNTLGLCLLKLERYDDANKNLLKAISLDNQNIVILNSLGRLNHELRKSKEAEIFFDKAFSLNPNSFETLNNMAGFYLEEEKYQKAINFYKKAYNGPKGMPIEAGLNSKLVRENGVLVEKLWRSGGMYGAAIDQIIGWLEKAVKVAENKTQMEALELLITYYKTGSLDIWDKYCIAWATSTEGNIDWINGFIEVYNDPKGYRGSYESIVEIKDFDMSKKMEVLSQHAQWFEDHSPIMEEHKKKNVIGKDTVLLDNFKY